MLILLTPKAAVIDPPNLRYQRNRGAAQSLAGKSTGCGQPTTARRRKKLGGGSFNTYE